MTATAKVGPDVSQELGASLWSPTWVAGTQVLGSSSAALSGEWGAGKEGVSIWCFYGMLVCGQSLHYLKC